MPTIWGVPDLEDSAYSPQARLMSAHLQALAAGVAGTDCVLSGGEITGGANLTPAVAKCGVLSGGKLLAVAAANVTIAAGDATFDRFDTIVVDSFGILRVRGGTAQQNPTMPDVTPTDVLLAVVFVPAGAATTPAINIKSGAVRRPRDILIDSLTSPVTHHADSSALTYYSLILPSGLLLAGKQIEVACGGDYLSNSGTPTWTFEVDYGGTSLVQVVTAATTADTDRGAWHLRFVLSAEGDAVQHLTGELLFETPGAKSAPGAGEGMLAVTTNPVTPLYGSSAVDSNAADRTLNVKVTMSVNDAAVETVLAAASTRLL